MNDFMQTLRIIDENRKDEFFNKGYKKRYFFPHEIYYLPRCGPEGFFFANRMWNISNPNSLWEIILYAWGNIIDEFPEELFFDNDIVWHQEHFGKPGQIATANLIIDGDKLYTLEHVSDIVQRVYIQKKYRTRIDSCFGHWHHILLNSILNFAVENNLTHIYSPSADFLIEKFYNGKVKPKVNRKYFDRIYDRDVKMHFDAVSKDGLWVIDVKKNRYKLISPEKRKTIVKNNKKTISVFHDIEKGLGNIGVEPVLAKSADNNAAETLKNILHIEKEANLKTTYNVVGSILNEVREIIEQDGHCIAFHSYNHLISRQPVTNYICDESAIMTLISKIGYKVTFCVNLARRLLSLPPVSYQPISVIYRKVANKARMQLSLPPVINQFAECRNIDWRIKGYRHYQPEITSEVSDYDLCYYNFEWIAIDDKTPGAKPALQNRTVKIPVSCDDSEMYKQSVSYETWEKTVIDRIEQSNFTAICLHGSYTNCWLPHYSKFLEKISSLGQLKTFNEVADQVFWSHSI
ncbi:hypothetical protein QUF90_16260 [Desulfococcaceae bacterium HSG9]|nr:hypothetical protein [Desulfococcaceae bacterium HSG9]